MLCNNYWALSIQQKSPVQIFGIFARRMERVRPRPAIGGQVGGLCCVSKMADFLNIFAALEHDDSETTSCTILDSNDDVIFLAAVASFMRRRLNRVNGYFEVIIPTYLPGEFENHFRMTRETCDLLTQEIMHTGQFIWAACIFARKANTAVFVECGK